MAVPSVLPDKIGGNWAQYFEGWVMSSVNGTRVEVCVIDGHCTVFIYSCSELQGSYSLSAKNKSDAITEFTKLIHQRRQAQIAQNQ